jgi:GNAT superfamily N-acetyltransferase
MYEITESAATGATFQTSQFLVRAARRRDADAIWAFVQANPEYELLVSGEMPSREQALEDFFDRGPPPDMTFTALHKLLVFNKAADGEAAGLAGRIDVCTDLMAAGVWHIGLFQIATADWGSGRAQALYAALEDWMMTGGAQMLRLSVADQNPRARRFWERNGYALWHTRSGVQMGRRSNVLHTLLKPVGVMTLDDYRRAVPGDAP